MTQAIFSPLSADTVLALQAAVLAEPDLAQAAVTLATRLATTLKLERVSIGLREGRRMRVLALSHGVLLDERQDLHQLLADAMDEAGDQAATVTLPPVMPAPRVTLAHAALRKLQGGAVCTIPLAERGVVTGAFTFERVEGAVFTAEEVSQWEHTVNLTGPLLSLKAKCELSWWTRLRLGARALLARWREPGATGFKLAVGGTLLLLVIVLFIPLPYSLTAPARTEGAVQRALVAAADGFIQQTEVRPGDRVKEGQVLAELAQNDLQLERSRRESEFAQHASAYSAAFAHADRAALMVSQAKMNEARAQLELVDQQLERTQIKAPFDGVIISGDLMQMLGAPVQRGTVLMTLAPAERYRLIVEVDERDVRDVEPGAAGRVALAAMPQTPLDFRVERVIPLSATRDGRHFFEVEGRLSAGDISSNAKLRPGLQGVARISARSRPLAAMVLGRMYNWLHMRLWSWGWLG